MSYRARIDWWIAAALALGVLAPLAGAKLWITIPLFLAVGICGYPQSYETAESGLVIHAGLLRRVIPYEAIRYAGPAGDAGFQDAPSADRIVVRYGANSGVTILPMDHRAFLADLEARAPHLARRGSGLETAMG